MDVSCMLEQHLLAQRAAVAVGRAATDSSKHQKEAQGSRQQAV
jgi:hypothetical protein